VTVYSGPCDIWNTVQTAVAASKYPHFPATQDGLDLLQEQWARMGHARPPKRLEDAKAAGMAVNMAWARAAMNDAVGRNTNFEDVPA
jgi:hypothetical protein